MRRRQMILCLMIVLLSAVSGVAQPGKKTPSSNTVTDIRKVDFLNFTYHSSLCSQEYPGIGKIVPVRKGEFKNKNVYFSVANDRIIYADVTGDGSEDAIVPIDCGANAANFSRAEIYIYTVQSGRATLVAETNDKDLERDYRRSYPDAESYWGIAEKGLNAKSGNLEIEVLVDGPHASPKYVATLVYRLNGKTLSLNGKPQRRPGPTE
jgi:hypothetical protein